MMKRIVIALVITSAFVGCGQNKTNDNVPELCKGKPTLCGFYLGQKFDPRNSDNQQKYAICNLKDDSIAWSKRATYAFDFKPQQKIDSCITYQMRVDKKTGRVMMVMAKCDDREESYSVRCARAESMTKPLEGKFKGKYELWKSNEGKQDEVSNYEFTDGESYHFSIRVHEWKFSCVLECDESFLDRIEEAAGNLKPRIVDIAKERRCDAEWNELWTNALDGAGEADALKFDKYSFGESYPDNLRMRYVVYVMGFPNMQILGDPMHGIRLTNECEENDKSKCADLMRGIQVVATSVENLYNIRLACYGDPKQTRWMYRNKKIDVLLVLEKRENKICASFELINKRFLK